MSILSKVFRKLITKKKRKFLKTNYKTSYSQCGEDLIVDYIFKLRGVLNPSYIDIGANDPFFLNNTNIFYQRGCRGINIDANQNCIQKFYFERPDDINLNIGVGPKKSFEIFYMLNDPTLSTFSENECQKYLNTGKYKLIDKLTVEISTIDEILSIHNGGVFPDFMSIDVEGLDFEIIKSIDFDKSSPKIICIEAAEYSTIGAGSRRDEIINFLIEKKYYEYANTNLNAIMVKRDFWFI